MFQLTEDVRSWLSGGAEGRERVVALHCKVQSRAPLLSNIIMSYQGGKGRTGTMICAVLVDMGLFTVIASNASIQNIIYEVCCIFRTQQNLFSILAREEQI